ncbi:ZrgA family zinc uptake protein [Saccharospirillum alexandrii]|uniref:ZrgA family zinc uptake protein n=1 Tax=Saccharospirillum alexandrii TaxID=2448477 RepID=UPI000FDC85BD|nr:DUF2796 domain-containing protein [Saccharospirillum alexandrii]
MTLKSTPALFALSLVALATSAQAETERQHGAHEHGAAQLTLAAENQTLAVSLDTPAYNLVGFEQAPATDAQRDQVASALAILARADAVLDLPAAARCTLTEQAVDADTWSAIKAHDDHEDDHHDEHEEDHHDEHADEHHDDHGHEEEHHDDHAHEDDHHDDHDHDHEESTHSDVLVEWTYRCENLDALSTVTVSAFEHFPNLTDLQVQYIGDDWQGGAQLTPASPRLTLN